MDILDRYHRAQDGFDALVARVPARRWDDGSACARWTNRDVLGHVAWGQELVAALATGGAWPPGPGEPGSQHPARRLTGDPVACWRAARSAADPLLEPAALARTVRLPAFGTVPLAGFVAALVVDFLAHTWDISAGTGVAVRLDPALVPDAFDWSRRQVVQRSPEGIGPEVEAPAGADEQTRFLAYLGRAPLAVPA
jgi:uncharacterized protein (TIGR03086 family)